jgi:hypothetical protein
MNKHTPGNWYCGEKSEKSGWIDIFTNDKDGKASLLPFISCRHFDQEANAHLIVAAPKMLAALKRQQANIRRWLETGEPATTEESKAISDEIDAAIYAAEGEI